MEILKETKNNEVLCSLCDKQPRKYTCPRCGVGYCNAECYKSDAHLECSESFYKQCVEEELKSQEADPEARKKMVEILKRAREEQMGDDVFNINEEPGEDVDDSQLDSDDEEETLDLETRMENINLDNPEEIWSALTDSEKQEFEALIKNGDVQKILPEWIPWWTYKGTKKLIEDHDAIEPPDYMKNCPTLIEVPLFNELQKSSPKVRYNILNVIYSYAYMALFYNGDYLNCAEEASIVFLVLCDTMQDNKVFTDSESAIESVAENIVKTEWLPKDEQTMLIFREAGHSILCGPEESAKTLYTSAAISEIHRLFNAAKEDISAQKNKSTKKEFSSRFPRSDTSKINLSKKVLLLYCKKLEYFLSWIKSYSVNN